MSARLVFSPLIAHLATAVDFRLSELKLAITEFGR